MFRKFLFSASCVAAVLMFSSLVLVAQSALVTGTVELHKADGTKEPVVDAVIEVYRMDIKATFPAAKTNRRGDFSIAGLPLTGTYFFNISGQGIEALIYPNVRAGQQRLVIVVKPGDGSKLTEDEVRNAVASVAGLDAAGAAKLSEDQKKAQAEFEAKRKEIEEKNRKAEDTNKILAVSLKDGNDAFRAKNYDLAIIKYDEGIAADPNYVGSAPVFYNNRGAALTARGVDTYNAAIRITDATEKFAAIGKAKKDISDSAEGYHKSWNILVNAPATEIVDKNNYDAAKRQTLTGARDAFQLAVRTDQVDEKIIESAKALIPEFIKSEPDAAKKLEARVIFADLFRVVGDSENAISAYMAILEEDADNHDALAGAGLSLVNLGYMNEDKTKLQEGANLLQRYATVAPDTHRYKADAVALIATLKADQNVTPQRQTPARRRP